MSVFGNTVPKDEATASSGPYVPMPSGLKVHATLDEARGVTSQKSSWEGVGLTFTVLSDRNGNDTFTMDGEEHRLTNRKIRALLTVRPSGTGNTEQVEAIAARQWAQVAVALGLADAAGDVDLEAAFGFGSMDPDAESVASMLQQFYGSTVGITVKTGPRKRAGQVQLKDDGTPWIDEEASNFFAA